MRCAPRFDFTAPVPSLASLGRVHFIAIGGSGMSGVAVLLLAHGLPVTGSDAKDSTALREVERAGAIVQVGHDAAHVRGADTVVISSAIREDNVELAAARAAGTRVLHRAQALAAALADQVPVAVAGANGKTTTTSMITVGLRACGLDPSFASGAVLPGVGSNAAVGSGDAFVVEADESDGSFLTYHPQFAVVTNVQPDHLDFYGTFDNVQDAYAQFVTSMRPGGLLIACADDAGSRALGERMREMGVDVLTYGWADDAQVRLSDATDALITGTGFAAEATLRLPGHEPMALRVATPGRHNLLNAAAAVAVCVLCYGADPARVLAGLAEFTGAKRRFEVRGRERGVVVVDDYAHNAGKVAALVRTVADLVGSSRVHVVFQPHLYSRTRDFADGFAAGLASAADVVLLPIYGAREEPMDGVSSDLIAERVTRLNPQARVEVAGDWDVVAEQLARRCAAGDVVLTVGAGDVTELAPRVLAALSAEGPS